MSKRLNPYTSLLFFNTKEEMSLKPASVFILDFIVPLGRFLRHIQGKPPFHGWMRLIFQAIPQNFFAYWLFSLIPWAGNFLYVIIFIPLSAWLHIKSKGVHLKINQINILLLYFVVILIGLGGLWSFIGHAFMADTIAIGIGWPAGSPFQTELAFYTLGSAIAAFMAVWLRGHMLTALIISKSIFWYGAAFVHIKDIVLHKNYNPLNAGVVLVGDIVFPTLLLIMLFFVLKHEFQGHESKNP